MRTGAVSFAMPRMITKYTEAVLAVRYRVRNNSGEWVGGPMYMIVSGLGQKWRPMAIFFSIFGLIGTLCIMQANQFTEAITTIFFTPEQNTEFETLKAKLDEATGMLFKVYCSICINLIDYNNLDEEFGKLLGREYIGICDHEQYFYEDYFAYQPDYAEKINKMCEILTSAGYEFIHGEDLIK